MELSGRVAIVTGSSRGIGREIAAELANAGARVVVNYRSKGAEAETFAATLPGAMAVQADVSTSEGCDRLAATAAELGEVDVLVNNAGITMDNLMLRMSDAQWDDVMAINAGGPFRMSRAVLPGMLKRRHGSIVNIVSVSALRGNPGQTNYSASKAAVIGLTRSLALELAKRNVRVNAVAPGFVDTDMTAALTPEQKKLATDAIPMRRMGVPGDIAPIVRFLCGPGAAYITGQVIAVDGGLSV
jgi:3-oxoacyl-[acyl-carrier protein] reductase